MDKDNAKKEYLERMRHSASHVMAQAVLNLFPKTKLGIGPAIENGFYYDFEFDKPISDEDLVKIGKEMKEIIKQKLPFNQKLLSRKEAEAYLKEAKQDFKLDLLEDIPDKKLSFYVTGKEKFMDLCRGPHMETTGKIGAIKLERIAGAYWKGDEKNLMLTRIYGLAFETKKELDEYLELKEKLKLADHRRIGKQMDLFSFHDEAPGMAFWHPKGQKLLNNLYKYWREVHEREGYIEVRTPELLTVDTWRRSGHTQTFKEKMYMAQTNDSTVNNYACKPMNCDGGMIIYKTKQRSYKDLPIKMGELGVVHRYESSGEVHGLLRVREFTQDDAHIYCSPDQVKEEIKKVIDLCLEFYDTFGLDLHHIELSTKPENAIGSDEVWERAESIMSEILEEGDIDHLVTEGEGAFYGPKFDFHLSDSMGRTWQCGTIQLDFAQPENFELEYVDENGEKQRPVMLHRVIYGSIERFVSILLEHYVGNLPLWLAPEQVRMIPIADRHVKYAKEVMKKYKNSGIVIAIDDRNETMQSRIREAEIERVPYMLVVGDKEIENNTVSVRPLTKKDQGMVDTDTFLKLILKEIFNKEHE
ncbi:MAG: threonine--tRNA ligase [bacterium]